jgi:hypothetical protein
MAASPEERLPHHVLFHRALLALIPAAGLSLAAYEGGFPWYFVVPALLCWGAGIRYLKLGSDRWNETQR